MQPVVIQFLLWLWCFIMTATATATTTTIFPNCNKKVVAMDASELLSPLEDTTQRLWQALEQDGFVVLKAAATSRTKEMLQRFQQALEGGTLFGSSSLASSHAYTNEDGKVLWNLGYHGGNHSSVRDMYRIKVATPNLQPWPSPSVQSAILQGMEYCKAITDGALRLTLGFNANNDANNLSVLHCIRYFNKDAKQAHAEAVETAERTMRGQGSGQATFYDQDVVVDRIPVHLNVREHVDPGLFVLAPFLPSVCGLQVCPTHGNAWITVDGSNINEKDDFFMLLIVGKAFCKKANEQFGKKVEPTLHRVVVTEGTQRYSAVYDQKYQSLCQILD
mmetsp:Transcript_8307/g.12844  ORF Transcript_8307/g.12844 Transcript_8307/m.12844 type:complete len:333 (-) Transcript_8307:72-1070(-)